MEEQAERRRLYYRWVFWLFGGWLGCGVVVAVVLLATITDANAGYPALFFGGLFLATAVPVSLACAILAASSLRRQEPYPRAMIALLVISALVAWRSFVPTLKYYAALVQTLLHFFGLPST
jgi:hypothetical protein